MKFHVFQHGSLGLLLIGAFANIRAESLDWKQKTIELSAQAKQEKIEATFTFTNSGAKPVIIQSTTASCDCTVPKLEKKVIKPGESGQLNVAFKLEGRVGLHEKTISVATSEDTQGPAILTLRVKIPELFEVKPRLVLWRIGEESIEKSVELYLAMNEAVSVVEAKADDPAIETRMETITPNRQYRLFLKPASTARQIRTVVVVKTKTVTTEQAQSFNVYAQIK